jgi:hypothetical protein
MNMARKAPIHLWIVGILSLLWNTVGALDYSATQFRVESYMANFTPEQLEYFYGFPAWADAAWALGVWGSFLGSVALLLRKSWAVGLFGISILGLAGTTVYNYVLSDGRALMGEAALMFTATIWVIVLFLYFYAQAMARRRVLQ